MTMPGDHWSWEPNGSWLDRSTPIASPLTAANTATMRTPRTAPCWAKNSSNSSHLRARLRRCAGSAAARASTRSRRPILSRASTGCGSSGVRSISRSGGGGTSSGSHRGSCRYLR